MTWDTDLLTDQKNAAGHFGTHARLLAGPGTGKTRSLTRRICFLIEERNVEPSRICALTFTRAAAHELRQRVQSEVGEERVPRISTLHSYALRQLMRNSTLLTALPQPLRIADDWEERNIILEDIKALLGLDRIDRARDLLNKLSADWQKLTADETDWDKRFPDPSFLGAWQEHRQIYGYVLRAELVYQLKRAFEQHGDFNLEGPPSHLLVDEYQDLNRCDLAVVKAVGDRGAEVYAAGDDDQSIYGFRMAHPEGIRRFPQDYQEARELTLEVCKRCDQEVLDIGLFVARQDVRRIEKPLHADDDRLGGQVAILRFPNQNDEALGVAQLCRYLIGDREIAPDGILILLRSDRNAVFSTELRQALESQSIPVGASSAEINPLNETVGRQLLALLRLLDNANDHLAWLTLLKLRGNGIGQVTLRFVYDVARKENSGFADTLQAIYDNPTFGGKFGSRIQAEIVEIRAILDELSSLLPSGENEEAATDFAEALGQIMRRVVEDEGQRDAIQHQFDRVVNAVAPTSINDFVRALEVSREDIEQEIEEGKVNILTMHKAKGLTAEAVIIVAAEDEYLPGRATGEAIDDERRLLYVSLTRPRHHMLVTYCDKRTGSQRHTGRTSGNPRRSLTRFLRDAPLVPQVGSVYIRNLGQDRT